MITFGPVPSRRLGQSLGINNIPPKSCTYSCVYCQVGPTHQQEITPRTFYSPEEILTAVESSLKAAERAGEVIDYLTFVPDGEPSLDENLSTTIKLLRPFGVKIAVISNASLIWREDVRERLGAADWLSLKIDSIDEIIWKRINQPHPDLRLDAILEGIQLMANSFRGELTTETMLVDGINNNDKSLSEVGKFLAQLNPAKAYLAAPIRPAAEAGIHPPSEEQINQAFQIIFQYFPRLEYLIGYEGNAFASTGDFATDLHSITSVHPMREEAVKELLKKSDKTWQAVSTLINTGQLKEIEYEGHRFYIRTMKNTPINSSRDNTV